MSSPSSKNDKSLCSFAGSWKGPSMTAGSLPRDPATSRSERTFCARPRRSPAQGRRTPEPVESHDTLVQAGTPGQVSEQPTRRGPFRTRGPRRPVPAAAEGEKLVLERYRLLERLGAGGFGVVWRARDELLHREVAVKRIWLGPDGDGERAAREAQASARLSHPAIVALYEACPLGEAFYLISELVDGETLAPPDRRGRARGRGGPGDRPRPDRRARARPRPRRDPPRHQAPERPHPAPPGGAWRAASIVRRPS